MRVGVALPQYDYSFGPQPRALRWGVVVDTARRVEGLGFHSIWMADHLFLGVDKYGSPAGEQFGYDPIVGLAALARATERVNVGPLVVCVQMRPPKLLARQLETLQQLSGGRLIAGFGAGWYEPEFRAAGIPFESPGQRLRQLATTLDIVADYDGSFPRWAGGRGDRFLQVVAEHADGWNTVWAWTPEAYRERAEVLDRACERVGRDPAEVTRSLGLSCLVGESEADLARRFQSLREHTLPGVLNGVSLDEWRVGRLVGTVEQVREQAAGWASLGVSELIAGMGALPFSGSDPDHLDLVASALIH